MCFVIIFVEVNQSPALLGCQPVVRVSAKVPKFSSNNKQKQAARGARHRKRKEEDGVKKIRHHHHNHIVDDRRRRQSWSQWRRSSTIHSYDEAVSWFSKCCLVDFQWEFHYDRRRRPTSDSFAPSFYFLLAFLVFLSFFLIVVVFAKLYICEHREEQQREIWSRRRLIWCVCSRRAPPSNVMLLSMMMMRMGKNNKYSIYLVSPQHSPRACTEAEKIRMPTRKKLSI